jgi:hypothetical protein
MQRPCILALATAAFGLAGLASTAMAEDLGGAGQWLARKHEESGRTFCYAISAPIQSSDAVDGRGPVGALVTNLEGGAARDQVSLALGLAERDRHQGDDRRQELHSAPDRRRRAWGKDGLLTG